MGAVSPPLFPLSPQTPTTSTSSQRTPASWAWWCAGAPPWCSSARRTAWRPSPTPSSSSRTPSGRHRPPEDSELPPPAARAPAGRSSLFYIGYVSVFIIKPQTPSVPEPQNLALSLGFLAGPSSGPVVCWVLGPGHPRQGRGPCAAGAPRAPWQVWAPQTSLRVGPHASVGRLLCALTLASRVP